MHDVHHPFYIRAGLSCGDSGYEIVAQLDVVRDSGGHATEILSVESAGRVSGFTIPWTVTRLARDLDDPDCLIGAGPGGVVFVRSPDGLREEVIDGSDSGPRLNGDIRDLQFVGSSLYAVGMSRQVYRRLLGGVWEHCDEGVIQQSANFAVVGFNAIGGLTETLVHAVGFGGEIWRRKNNRWSQIDSPTNLVLTAVQAYSDRCLYACGQRGTLLWIDGDRVRIIGQDQTIRDFWAIALFGSHIFVATDDTVLRIGISSSPTVEVVLEGYTCGDLHAARGVLYSFGDRHVFRSYDGIAWEDVTPDETKL